MSQDLTPDPVVPTGPAKQSLELVLANQANDAMRKGADPHATTDMLGTMLRHIRANPDLASQGEDALSRGADPGQVAHKVWEMAQASAPQPKPGLGSRVASNVGNAVRQLVTHPLDTAAGVIEAPVKSLISAMAPSVGAPRTSAALSKGGNSSGRPIDTTPYDAEHGGVTGQQRLAGAAQTVANIALPGVARGVTSLAAHAGAPALLGRTLSTAAAGGVGGAAYTPDDPLAGGIAGAVLAPTLGAAAKGAERIGGKVGSGIVDMVGRPAESRPAIQAGPVKVGTIEGINDRAARLNAQGLDRAGFFTDVPETWAPNDKPQSPADLQIGGQRMLRGLKTASPAAEQVIRGDLEPRTEGTVERVIGQAKDLTGIKRSDAFETHEQLKQNTAAEGDAAYGKAWGAGDGPMVDLAAERATPAGQIAWKRAERMMANDGYQPTSGRPPGIPDEQWTLLKPQLQKRGVAIAEDGEATLRQAHYFKLALDDLKQPGLNIGPGEGGLGYNEGRSIHGVQKRLLAKMDAASPDYAKARSQFADNKSLENASELGADHWTRDPSEAKALLRDMSPAEQKIYRDNAFDKWATRVENGAENVGKAQAKSLNQKRLRLLFPDDKSFADFQQGLKQEAQMYATEKGVLSGSNTADKLADMANDAGVTLPEVLSAAGGHVMPLVRGVATRGLRALGTEGTDRLAVARAKLLTAGASGDPAASEAALEKMRQYRAPLPQRQAP